MRRNDWTKILGWPGYAVYQQEIDEKAKTLKLWVRRKRGNRRLICSGCGARIADPADVTEREVRDLPCFQYRTTVVIELYRVRCPNCGLKIEKVEQLPSKAPFSKRFEEAVGEACESASARRVVWWLEARLMEERERACDEEVLRNGGEPRAYTEGILKICELYPASPLACVAGVTGGDLKRRIEAIMQSRGTQTELRKEGDPGGCRESGRCDSYRRWHHQYACGPGSILPSCSIRCHAEIRSGLHQGM